MPLEIVLALIAFVGVIAAGAVGAGAAVWSAELTARRMAAQTERQIKAAAEAERARFRRELRENRVADLRGLLQALRSAVGHVLNDASLSKAADSPATGELIRRVLERHGEEPTDEAVEDVRTRLRQLMREDEGITDPPGDIVRTLGRLQVEVPPSGPIREALRLLYTNWSMPMLDAGKLDWGVQSLASLVIHADEVEGAIDSFVIGDDDSYDRPPARP